MNLKKMLMIGALTGIALFGVTSCSNDKNTNNNDNNQVEVFDSFHINLIVGESTTRLLIENKNFNISEFVPEIEGKNFLGWYLDENFTIKIPDFFPLTPEITLYGKVENNEIEDPNPEPSEDTMAGIVLEALETFDASVTTNVFYSINVSDNSGTIRPQFINTLISQYYDFDINNGEIISSGRNNARIDDFSKKSAVLLDSNNVFLQLDDYEKNHTTNYEDGSTRENKTGIDFESGTCKFNTDNPTYEFVYNTAIYLNETDYLSFEISANNLMLSKSGDKLSFPSDTEFKFNANLVINHQEYNLSNNISISIDFEKTYLDFSSEVALLGHLSWVMTFGF